MWSIIDEGLFYIALTGRYLFTSTEESIHLRQKKIQFDSIILHLCLLQR